jgi:hypothetical protein
MTIGEQLASFHRYLESEERQGSIEGLSEITACMEARSAVYSQQQVS